MSADDWFTLGLLTMVCVPFWWLLLRLDPETFTDLFVASLGALTARLRAFSEEKPAERFCPYCRPHPPPVET